MRKNARRDSLRSQLSGRARASLAAWLAADLLLYNHFAGRLEERLEEAGRARVAAQVEELRRLNRAVVTACSLEEVEDTARLAREFRLGLAGVVGHRGRAGGDCALYAITEIAFVQALRRRQQGL